MTGYASADLDALGFRHDAFEGELRRHIFESGCFACSRNLWCAERDAIEFQADVALRQWIDARDGQTVA